MRKITCPCGKEFICYKNDLSRGKYCSKKCFYKYRKRKSGLKYNIIVINKGWFKHGQSGNKGKKASDIARAKMSKAKKGKRMSIKTEFKKGDIRIVGKNNHNWKGGITPVLKQIRHSYEYKKWIKLIFKRDDWTCKNCNKRGGKLEAHHIRAFSKIINENHIKTLEDALKCKECHKLTNNYKFKTIKI